jgi:hypothetical protein
MPHDCNGKLLKVGDVVNMQFKIKEIHNTEEYCNVNLESVLTMPPTGNRTTLGAVNTKQVEKVGT